VKALAENLATLERVETNQVKLRNALDTGKSMGRTQERIRTASTLCEREDECDAAREASNRVNVRLLLKSDAGVERFVYRKGELIEYEGIQPTGKP
jgi:hypothetical protein